MQRQNVGLSKGAKRRQNRRIRDAQLATAVSREQRLLAQVPTVPKNPAKTARRRRNKQRRRDLAGGLMSGQDTGTEMYGATMNSVLAAVRGNPYLEMLVSPKTVQMRYPDENCRPSALYISQAYFDVVGNNNANTAAADLGKFSFVVRPVLSSPVAYVGSAYQTQVTYFNPTIQWNFANFQALASYILVADSNYQTLVGTPNANNTNINVKGLLRDYRPVAMSVWFQYTGDTLNDGGNVAACLVDGTLVDQLYFANPVSPGDLQEFRNLAEVPMAYDGRIRDGTYTYWFPWDSSDSDFRVPWYGTSNIGTDQAEIYNWPSIVVSGQTSHPGVIVGRIEVNWVFEYTTSSRLVEQIPSPVNPELIVHARKNLATMQSSMANDDHMAFINRLVAAAGPGTRRLLTAAAPLVGGYLGRQFGGPFGGIKGAIMGRRVARSLLG